MKRINNKNNMMRIASVLLLLCMMFMFLVSCTITTDPTASDETQTEQPSTSSAGTSSASPTTGSSQEFVDYVAQLKLDMNSETVKQEATVKAYIDGDTTHFNVPSSVSETGVLKARYLAINTPESTGKVEPWGKKASNFTKEKLKSAVSIIVESDDANWNLDSTGGRHLVWIWYKTSQDSEYRNLNLEILQNGYAIASSSANNRYGSTCVAALNQAKQFKLRVHSSEPDDGFYYGKAQEITLRELRTNIEKYNGTVVAFEGVVTRDYSNGVYVEDYDDETGMYYGMYIYYGFGTQGDVLRIISEGNRARIVGTVSYYETGGTYQVSGLNYRAIKPNDPENVQLVSSGHQPAYVKTSPEQFKNGTVSIECENENNEIIKRNAPYAEMALGTSISMDNLKVKKIYTTTNDASSSKGAMTITCECDGVEIDVRTVVLYDENKNLVTASAYEGKTINVQGIIDYFDGGYQIKVFSTKDITVVG